MREKYIDILPYQLHYPIHSNIIIHILQTRGRKPTEVMRPAKITVSVVLSLERSTDQAHRSPVQPLQRPSSQTFHPGLVTSAPAQSTERQLHCAHWRENNKTKKEECKEKEAQEKKIKTTLRDYEMNGFTALLGSAGVSQSRNTGPSSKLAARDSFRSGPGGCQGGSLPAEGEVEAAPAPPGWGSLGGPGATASVGICICVHEPRVFHLQNKTRDVTVISPSQHNSGLFSQFLSDSRLSI